MVRKEFIAKMHRAKHVSRGAAGIRSETAQHYWASVLFTRMVVTGKTIQILTPKLQPDVHWDFSAVASITRNLAECYLFFYFLCIDDVPQVEKDARTILLYLHDNASRHKLFPKNNNPEYHAKFAAANAKVHDDLVQKFKANIYLSSLPEKRQNELIKGAKTPFVQDEVIEQTTIDKDNFRFLYRLFSQHTHSGPMAFFRMAEHGRGHGFQNYLDTLYMAFALEQASDLIQRATTNMMAFFPDADTRGAAIETMNKKKR